MSGLDLLIEIRLWRGALKSHENRPTIKLTFIVSVLNKDKLA